VAARLAPGQLGAYLTIEGLTLQGYVAIETLLA
jgi:hypothetical protein